MFYVLWITLAIISYIITAILSKQLNDTQSTKWLWMIIAWQLGGVWPLVAMYSKSLIFDALIYDLIIFLAYYSTLIYLGSGHNFTLTQWLALAIIGIGMTIFKLSG